MTTKKLVHQIFTATLTMAVLLIGQPIFAQGDAANTSDRFQLGTHYDRLSPTQPTSSSPDQVEVAEVFWYGCPHCYTFDPFLENWKSDIPDNVNFVRIPAVWKAFNSSASPLPAHGCPMSINGGNASFLGPRA